MSATRRMRMQTRVSVGKNGGGCLTPLHISEYTRWDRIKETVLPKVEVRPGRRERPTSAFPPRPGAPPPVRRSSAQPAAQGRATVPVLGAARRLSEPGAAPTSDVASGRGVRYAG